MKKGIFIVFEGVDGSGKSTQLELLNKYLQTRAIKTFTTREPGGTPVGERIRDILLDPTFTEIHERTEVLLYAAARAQLVAQEIWPKLDLGTVVLCDRYIDSSLAYQGYGRGMEIDFLVNINRLGSGDLQPDLTILLDLPPEDGLARSRKARPADRLENEALDFHRRVRNGYLELSKQNNKLYLLLDARSPIGELNKAITAVVGGLLGV